MNDTISRQAAIDKAKELFDMGDCYCDKYSIVGMINSLPSVQPDDKLAKIADLVEGTIYHFDLDDAIDLLYQIKEVLK